MTLHWTMIVVVLGPWLAIAGHAGASSPRRDTERYLPVEVVRTRDGFALLRGGEPYFIRGAGGTAQLDLVVAAGGNSIRTWGERQLEPREWPDGRVRSLLDVAHEKGISVCAGFWVQHPRHGFSYDDAEAVERQIEEAVAFVNRWKHHPAILMWGIGNEVALYGDHARLFKEVDRIAAAVKKADPSRPTMSALAGVWPEQGRLFAQLCPNVDILGLNAYHGLPPATQAMTEQGYDGPFVVTEFGPMGHWEAPLTPWGAPIEQPSAGKARSYEESYHTGVLSWPARCFGAYAFVWGQKQEVTESWYGMFLKTGEKLQTVDTMARLWSGRDLDNLSPIVERIESEAALRHIAPDTRWAASANVADPDGDTLTFRWRVVKESTDRRSGGDEESVPPDVPGLVEGDGSTIAFRAPTEEGAYRLFLTVYDGQGGAGTANMPFYVAADGARPNRSMRDTPR